MAQQTYTIEMKLDASDEAHAAMTEIVKQYARDLIASGMLLSGGKSPLVVCRTTDNFYDTKEIESLDPSELLHT